MCGRATTVSVSGRWLALLLLLSACRVDATVTARVDGRSGEVRARFELDAEAVAVLGGQVAEGAQVADLRRAGWTIPAPDRKSVV